MLLCLRIFEYPILQTWTQLCRPAPQTASPTKLFGRKRPKSITNARSLARQTLMWVSSLFYVENACLCKTVRSCRLYLLLAAKPVNALRTGLTTLRSFLRYLIDRSWVLLSKKTPRCTRFFRNWIQSLRGNLATKSNRTTGRLERFTRNVLCNWYRPSWYCR